MFTLENDLVTCSECGAYNHVNVASRFSHRPNCKAKGTNWKPAKACATQESAEKQVEKATWRKVGPGWGVSCKGGKQGETVKVYRRDGSSKEVLLGIEVSHGVFSLNQFDLDDNVDKALACPSLFGGQALNGDF